MRKVKINSNWIFRSAVTLLAASTVWAGPTWKKVTAGGITGSINANQVNAGSFQNGAYTFPNAVNLATTAGNIGIGTGSPLSWSKLDVVGPTTGNGLALYADGGGDLMLAPGGSLFFDGNYSYALGNYIRPLAANTQAFFTSGQERMRITPGGNVGIGTASPGQKLDIQGGAVNASGGFLWNGQSLDTRYAASASATQWSNVTGGINYSGGNVGIGITPSSKLELSNGEIGIGQQIDFTSYMRLGMDSGWTQYLANNAYWTGSAYNYVNTGGYGGLASRIAQVSGQILFDTSSGGANPITWNNRMTIANNGTISASGNIAANGGITLSGGNTITGLPDTPPNGNAAVDKNYVDAAVASMSPGARVQTFTSNGTFTPPSGITSVKVSMCGGGGGGGAGDTLNSGGAPGPAGGGGGGGGQCVYKYSCAVTGPVSVSVGVAGTGGTGTTGAGNTGTNGGSSSFGTCITANGGGGGGGGGLENALGTGGASGGSGGGSGASGGRYTFAIYGAVIPIGASGGTGGGSFYGTGGAGADLAGIGASGSGFGSGGGGGGGTTYSSPSPNGGNGAGGIVIVEW